MRRLDPPDFDDFEALQNLSLNPNLKCYPHLQAHVSKIMDGYRQYIAANGNSLLVDGVSLPPEVRNHLKRLYVSPPETIKYIKQKRLSLSIRFADILCRGSRLKRFGCGLTETAIGHLGWRGSAQIVPKVDFSKGGARAETHFGRSVRQAADARISESVAGTTLTAIPRRLSKAER